jgi:hypothetical protein
LRIKALEKEVAHLREVNEIVKKRTFTLSIIQVNEVHLHERTLEAVFNGRMVPRPASEQ